MNHAYVLHVFVFGGMPTMWRRLVLELHPTSKLGEPFWPFSTLFRRTDFTASRVAGATHNEPWTQPRLFQHRFFLRVSVSITGSNSTSLGLSGSCPIFRLNRKQLCNYSAFQAVGLSSFVSIWAACGHRMWPMRPDLASTGGFPCQQEIHIL